MGIAIRPFHDERLFIEAVAGLLAEELTRNGKTPHAVMLSGGKTPLAAYDALAQSGVVASESAHVLFSDERMVSSDSPESNYGHAAQMLSALGIRDERVLRVHTELPLEAAASRYSADITAFFEHGGRIGAGLLGIGTDGHTASLFTLADAERGASRWAIPVPRTEGPDRVSVTAALIQRIDRVVFVVAGAEKEEVAEILRKEPDRIPAGRAVQGIASVELWQI